MYPHRPMATTHRPDTLAREQAHELVRAWDGRPGALGSLLGRVSSVDQVGVEERVDALKRRSIKKASKLWALDLAIRMIDLTTLEGKDTPGKIRALCQKAMRPQPGDPTIPSVAAICIYPALVAEARDALKGSTVKVAIVATGFPSGQTFRDIKIAETRAAAEAGADEIDMVIDRGAFLQRRLPDGLRGDRRRQGGLRRRAPQGHPRDRRARDVRQRPAGERPRDGGRRRLHQDLHRQGHAGGDAAGHARDVRGGPRLRAPDGPPGRHQAGGRHPDGEGGDPVPRRRCTRRSGRAG